MPDDLFKSYQDLVNLNVGPLKYNSAKDSI